MAPGILYVRARTLDTKMLSEEAFGAWYEAHIHEVLALPGVSSAVRYETDLPGEDRRELLTIYHFPDAEYRNSLAWKNVSGTVLPQETIDTIHKRAWFDFRFYEEVGGSPSGTAGPGTHADGDGNVTTQKLNYLFPSPSTSASPEGLSQAKFVQQYKLLTATLLDGFNVVARDNVPPYLTLSEFAAQPQKEEVGGVEGEGEKLVYTLRKVYV